MLFLSIIGVIILLLGLLTFINIDNRYDHSGIGTIILGLLITFIPHMFYYYDKKFIPECITISVDNNTIYQGPERLVSYYASSVNNTNNDLNPIKIYKVRVYTDAVYYKTKTIYEGDKIYSVEACKEDK